VRNGDRVVVRGEYVGSALQARRVRVTNDDNFDWNDNNDWDDNGWDDNNDYNRVTIRGVVTRDLWDNDEFEIRAENGRTYRVNMRRNQPRNLSQGDRVEIIGDVNGNVLRAESVRIISDNNGGWNGGLNSTTLSGVVTRDLEGRRFEIRDSSGRTVQVISESEPSRLRRGDRVYLRGRWERNVFRATSVSLNDINSGYGSTVGSRVNFPGVVTSIASNNRLAVRGDNGRTYNVQLNEQLPRKIDVGDRVRVQGTVIYGGVVRATDVDLLSNVNKRDERENNGGRYDVNLTGVVTSSTLLGGLITVRGDDGRDYRVRVSLSQDVRRGDRVRIRGYRDGNGLVTATTITRY
jgi:cytochrome c-type biogenesis protein CcmE